MIVAVPALRPVTTPFALTEATAGFEDSHLTLLFCASAGTMFALSVYDIPIFILAETELSVTPVTVWETITVHFASYPPS